MNIKETRCDCCGKVLNKHMDKIIHGKFNRTDEQKMIDKVLKKFQTKKKN